MQTYEYKVIPAPAKGRKGAGVKGAEARFAYGLEQAINEMAAQGWEYQRADILPSEERQGLTSTQTVYRSVLVFRKALKLDAHQAPEVESLEVEPVVPSVAAAPLVAHRAEPEAPANMPAEPPLTAPAERVTDQAEDYVRSFHSSHPPEPEDERDMAPAAASFPATPDNSKQ